MKKTIIITVIVSGWLFTGCSSPKPITIPLQRSLEWNDTYTIIWNGISKAYRYDEGKWKRDDSYDYQFDVVQKRYENRWKSVKSLHRLHPDYNGKAGDRDQTMYFEIDYRKLVERKVQADIHSSLGNGTGITDSEFRQTELVMYVPQPSSFMPYNKFRISQNYNYESGVLTETVELILEKDGKEFPFMKNEETALIFVQGKLDKAPTSFRQ
ncbi:MAG: hypothetical protein K2Q22_16710 [Cytophagales bacterium]|nr:hypothetical protein [Cytophagales bacterium]